MTPLTLLQRENTGQFCNTLQTTNYRFLNIVLGHAAPYKLPAPSTENKTEIQKPTRNIYTRKKKAASCQINQN